jgi:DNA-binding NarL/FixJ family response regulator
MAEGKSNRQIAVALTLAVSTVKCHVSNILSKLDAENRTEAVAIVLQKQRPAWA